MAIDLNFEFSTSPRLRSIETNDLFNWSCLGLLNLEVRKRDGLATIVATIESHQLGASRMR